MAFTQEEIRNFSFKGWNSILGTGNRSTAPDNLTYYEEMTTNSLAVYPNQILSEFNIIPPAKDISEASNNASANPTIIKDFTNAPIHLTPSPNNKAFFATEIYDDLSTRMLNFIMPQAIPRTDSGNEGRASIGYGVKLYQGNPLSGGTQITTTIEQSGADVGWFFMYGAGAIVVASDFTAITDPTDVWITAFQYIGETGTSSDALTEVPVDDITIEMQEGYSERANTGDTRYAILEKYWMNGIPEGSDGGWKGATAKDGVLQQLPDRTSLAVWNDGTDEQDVYWDAGTYEFYSTINLDSTGVILSDYNGTNYTFTNMGKEGVFYRYSVTIPSVRIYYFNTYGPIDEPYSIYLIDRYNDDIKDEITIKNIDSIIDGNMISIDGSFTDASNSHRELVTRNFVESRIPDADEITIKSTLNDIIYSTVTDYQYLINDVWDNNITTSGWNIDTDVTYLNGVFNITLADSEQVNLISHPTAKINTARRAIIISDYDFVSGSANMVLYDDTSGLYSQYYKQEELNSGEFAYTFDVPAGYTLTEFRVTSGTSAVSFNIKFAVMDKYPPNAIFKIKEIDHIIDDDGESIDGSDTPMSDPHRELVTRAYVDTGRVLGYTQTFQESDLTSGILSVSHNLNAQDMITHVTVKNENNKHIIPDDITDISSNTVEIDLSMAEPINGTWTVLVTCLSIPIIENQTKEINSRTLNNTTLN